MDVTKPATVYSFDLDNETEALKIAKEIADKTGRAIVVRDAGGELVGTVVPTNSATRSPSPTEKDPVTTRLPQRVPKAVF